MRKAVWLLAMCACGAGAPNGSDATITLASGTAALTVEVLGARTEKGTIDCALFNAEAGFPGPSPIVGGAVRQSAQPSVVCQYQHLPAGTYALSVQHDENGNGTLDTNFVGVPTEGYAVTNDVIWPTRAPTFDEAKLTLADGEERSLQVHLHY